MPEAQRLPVAGDVTPSVRFTFEARSLVARPGETVATALSAAGVSCFRRSRLGEPRGPFCNMGACLECTVSVDGEPVRACLTPVREGMAVTAVVQGPCAPIS